MRDVYNYYITDEDYAIAKKNGIKPATVWDRVRRHGWSKQDAITKPVRKNGKLKKWIKIAESNGISYTTFANRIYILGWSLEKASTVKNGRNKYPKWVFDNLEKNGIKYNTFVYRVKNGWDMETACTGKTLTNKESLKRGRKKQKELNIGPYRFTRDFNKICEAKKGVK